MSFPAQLLEQARHLVAREAKRPKQASLRRAISAAYYSLFHLLTLEAGGMFATDPSTIKMLARAYDHGKIARDSKLFVKGELPRKLHPLKARFFDPTQKPTLDRLKSVAQAFVDLQDARHSADYDLNENFSRQETENVIKLAETAFSDWRQIKKDDLPRIYLACFLLYEDWNKER